MDYRPSRYTVIIDSKYGKAPIFKITPLEATNQEGNHVFSQSNSPH